jgi:P27 family predicted phage terminase small subunit
MKPGPKPRPTNLRLLEGSRSDRPNPAEPIILGDKPAAPEWLDDFAREEWDRLADPLYEAGVLTPVDQTMLAAYCMAYSRWRAAESVAAKLRDQDPTTLGLLIRTKDGNIIQNPIIGVANVARRDMARLAAEFGLSPSSRTLIAGKREDDEAVARKHFG